MFYSCTHVATVGVKGLITSQWPTGLLLTVQVMPTLNYFYIQFWSRQPASQTVSVIVDSLLFSHAKWSNIADLI